MTAAEPCLVCDRNRFATALPVWEQVYLDDQWRLTIAFDTSLPGWLVLVPLRHVEGLHELTAAEASGLGPLLRAASAALVQVTGCVKTYVMLFAEGEGFAHVHLHVVPRAADLPEDRRGPRVFGYLGAPADQQPSARDRDRLAAGLRDAMAVELQTRG